MTTPRSFKLAHASLCLMLALVWMGPTGRPSAAASLSTPYGQLTVQESRTVPRVDVWPTVWPATNAWATAPIFWFGRATDSDNYVDVRVLYDSQTLYLRASVVDYYVWFDETGTTDPRGYDAIAFYLDTQGNRTGSPQPDDYFLVSGFHAWPSGNDVRWQRQGRGSASGWNESWVPPSNWTDDTSSRYYNSGPNDNSDLDAGWTTTVAIPWSTVGLAGPPAAGTSWGLGVQLFDRDDRPPLGAISPKSWPNGFLADAPDTWGSLAFDPPSFKPLPAIVEGTTTIRRGLNGNVADAYVGGGGTCGGGRFGGGDVPHPDADLYVQNQADIADFPCFSKSYLRFDIGAIPAGKTVISATLRMYEYGGSDPTQAKPSFIQVFSVSDPWDENTITWNNAPLAAENLGGSWVDPLQSYPGWPGVAVDWDATRLVNEALANGQPANLVLYSSDTDYHSGKYFVSSESGDPYTEGRPSLIIDWGEAAPKVDIAVRPAIGVLGDVLTYSIVVTGSGQSLQLVNPLPNEVEYLSGSVTGGAVYDSASNAIRWGGTMPPGETLGLTFQVRVKTGAAAIVTSVVTVTDGINGQATSSAIAVVNGHSVVLPDIRR